MAEKQDEKSRLPLAGLIALVAMISGFLYYEGITLKTVRPIDKEKATTMFQKKGLVQSRLWQDPFEAIEAHRLLEQKLSKQPEEENECTRSRGWLKFCASQEFPPCACCRYSWMAAHMSMAANPG